MVSLNPPFQYFPVVIKYDKFGNYLGTPVLGEYDPSKGIHYCPNMIGGHHISVDGAGNIYMGGSNGNFNKYDWDGME